MTDQPSLTDDEKKLCDAAVIYVKENVANIVQKFSDLTICIPSDDPVSVFMAGAPGAGKTEISKRLLEQFTLNKPVRIDADEIRAMLPDYHGGNAHVFQKASSLGVDKLYDYALKKRINVIMDNTFASERSLLDVERSINHKRRVEIYYLFQEPTLSWKYTQAREITEGRRISEEVFIRALLESRKNVNAAKKRFKERVVLNLVIHNFDKGIRNIKQNIGNIDEQLPDEYTVDNLRKALGIQ